jgi:hypothetical protein
MPGSSDFIGNFLSSAHYTGLRNFVSLQIFLASDCKNAEHFYMLRRICICASAVCLALGPLIVFWWALSYRRIYDISLGSNYGLSSYSGIIVLSNLQARIPLPIPLAMPYSYLLIAFAGVGFSLFRLPRWLIHRRERRCAAAGLCPQCGYDLRATPLRCPDCGAEARNDAASANPPATVWQRVRKPLAVLAALFLASLIMFDFAPLMPAYPAEQEITYIDILMLFLIAVLAMTVLADFLYRKSARYFL